MESKKEIFKLLIKEFHELNPPNIIKRDCQLLESCTASSSPFSVIAITGPRRCGKTYFIHQLIEHFCSDTVSPLPRNRLFYINFEDDRLYPLNLRDLAALLDAYYELYPDNRDKEVFIFLDDIQQVEGWQRFLHRLLDRENVRLFITSSATNFHLNSFSSALSCRTLEFAISPLTFREFLSFKGLDLDQDFAYSGIRFKVKSLLQEYLVYGGYPEVALTDLAFKFRILKNYYDILIYKDMVEQYSIRNIRLLKSLLKHLITNIGSAFSVNSYYLDIQPQLHISRETICEYVSHIKEKDLIRLVPKFSDSHKVRRVNLKKVYSLDNGIRNAVSFPLPHHEEKLVKNLVFQKLTRSGNEVFYWNNKGEIDFVARENNKLSGICVSYGRELGNKEVCSLLGFQNSMEKYKVDMTVITKDTEKTENGVRFSPLWKWLLT